MKPVHVISGKMAPLPRANVDTDQIIPKQFLKRVERSGFGPYLFYDWAFDAENEPVTGFVLNQPEYQDATVLVSGPNFGCGSSREHAPWSLEDWGFQCIIAPSFADIFYNNCINVGLLPVVLQATEVAELTRAATSHDVVTVDLEAQTVTYGDEVFRFDIDPFAKTRLRAGLDQVALTLQHDAEIEVYEHSRPGFLPSL
jgi:3-isopropylmalate/(R)-2-methylmalate dehydratase small subunit